MGEIINKSKYRLLNAYFSRTDFQSGQEKIIDAIINGTDTLAIIKNSSLKAICYQLSALMMSGITLVVSPNLAEIREQVYNLNESGIRAVYINTSLNWEEIEETLKNADSGMYKLIYITPKTLLQERCLKFLAKTDISMIVLDEAHCISQLGHDFIPEYTQIVDFILRLDKRPVVAAFTMPVAKYIRHDIITTLQLKNPTEVIAGNDSNNIYLEVLSPFDKFIKLCDIIDANKTKSIIVYCMTRTIVEDVHDRLSKKGILAAKYHAGMTLDEKRINQDDFHNHIKNIIIATSGYKTNINTPDISVIIHYNMPRSIESYYQETLWRAGDSSETRFIVFYSPSDIKLNSYLIEKNSYNYALSKEENRCLKKNNYKRLSEINHYCMTSECLKKTLLKYFDEDIIDNCENCSNCKRKI